MMLFIDLKKKIKKNTKKLKSFICNKYVTLEKQNLVFSKYYLLYLYNLFFLFFIIIYILV